MSHVARWSKLSIGNTNSSVEVASLDQLGRRFAVLPVSFFCFLPPETPKPLLQLSRRNKEERCRVHITRWTSDFAAFGFMIVQCMARFKHILNRCFTPRGSSNVTRGFLPSPARTCGRGGPRLVSWKRFFLRESQPCSLVRFGSFWGCYQKQFWGNATQTSHHERDDRCVQTQDSIFCQMGFEGRRHGIVWAREFRPCPLVRDFCSLQGSTCLV